MKGIFPFLLFLSLFCWTSEGRSVKINNVVPRRDTQGNIMDIHDGNTLYIGGKYYYYGASYGSCKEPAGSNGCSDAGQGTCGFRLDHNVSLFISDDLGNWTFSGHVFEMAQAFPGIMFCPKVIFNPKTSKYVLWFNWIAATGSFGTSLYAVATSSSPLGPFVLVNKNITLGYDNTGDFNLFLDDDNQGYIIYTSHITGYAVTHQMSIERLDPTFTGTLGLGANSGFFGSSNVEAPAFFKRNNKYYAVFGSCCCYCQQGSPVSVYTSSKPLGPYRSENSLGDKIPAQQTNILPFYSTQGTFYLWQGDRWQSAPDGIKGHDFSYWGVLNFDDQGHIQPLPFLNDFTIEMP